MAEDRRGGMASLRLFILVLQGQLNVYANDVRGIASMNSNICACIESCMHGFIIERKRKMIIHKCDKCGTESEPGTGSSSPTKWQSINYNIGRAYHTKHLCPECCEKLGIPPYSESNRDTVISDNLIDILTEISSNIANIS